MTANETGRFRTLIVDDERLARDNLRGLLTAHTEILIVGEASNADEAEIMIRDRRPDLIFLDIQMPGASGFDLLERLVSPPPVIFVTAYDSYAIRAFEVNAVDYLLKPVESERLARAIHRMEKGEVSIRVPSGMFRHTDRVFLYTGRQAVFLPVADIAAITAEGNYSHVVSTAGQSYMVRVSTGSWGERLPRDLFFLLDRSLLINRSHVVRCVFHGRQAELYLGNIAQPFVIGRTAIQRLKEYVLAHTPQPTLH